MVDQPRSVSGVVRRGLALWAESATTLWSVLIPLAVVSQLVSVIAMTATAPSGSSVVNGTIFVPAGSATGAIRAAHLLGVVLTALVGVLGAGVALHVFGGVATGSRPRGAQALRFARSRFGGLLWLGILYLAVVAGGTLLLILPGIYVLIACTAAFPVLAVEDGRGLRALGRSRELSKGRWWATLGAIAPSWILVAGGVALVDSTLRGSGSVSSYALTQAFGGLVIQVLLVPIATAASFAVYLELRARHDPLPATVAGAAVALAPPPATPSGGDIWWS